MAKINGIEITGISKVGPVIFFSAAKFNGIAVVGPARGFVTEWTVSGDVTARTITLPLYNSGTFNCTVKWGDGTVDSTITSYNDSARIHTYASNGTYEVEITGECPSWSFNNTGDILKITDIIDWGNFSLFGGFQYLTSGFYGCTNLKSLGKNKILSKNTLLNLQNTFRNCSNVSFTKIPSGIFDDCIYLENFSNTFNGCSNLTTIPSGLFDKNINVSINAFAAAFRSCPISRLPIDLFKYNTAVSSSGFSATFLGGAFSSIPSGFFDYNVSVSTSGFLNTFYQASNLLSIPSGLFNNNIYVSSSGFNSTFYGCSSLVSVPSDLFKYNTDVSTSGFQSTFLGCSSLESIPSNLFRYNINVSSSGFYKTFYNCNKLQQNFNTFYANGEQTTRFKDRVSNFYQCFYRTSFTGTQGTAPDLWNCDFGTQTPTTTDCWDGAGNSITSLTNYNDIPSVWK